MAKICELCGKSTVSGNSIQHKHSGGWMYKAPKTKRTFKPNLRKVKAVIDGDTKTISVCAKCLRSGKVTRA